MIYKGDLVKINMSRVKKEPFKKVFLRKFQVSHVTGRNRGIVLSAEEPVPVILSARAGLWTTRTILVQFNHLKYPIGIDERHLDVVKTGPRHPLTSIFK